VLPVIRAAGAPTALISLRADRDGSDGCAFAQGGDWCSPALRTQAENADLDRVAQLTAAADYTVTATARPRASPVLDPMLVPAGGAVLTASSRASDEPAQRPQAAFDDDPATAWQAAPGDPLPRVRLTWSGRRTVAWLRWQITPGLAVSRPTRVEVITGGRSQSVPVSPEGWVLFAPVRTNRLDVQVTQVRTMTGIDPATGLQTRLPVGASEVDVPALGALHRPLPASTPVSVPCGDGPPLVLGGTSVPTELSGTAQQALRREPMTVTPCGGPLRLGPGPVRIRLDRTTGFLPVSVVLRPVLRAPASPADQVGLGRPLVQLAADHRRVVVPPAAGQQLLVVHENANPGWRATLGGRVLPSVRIDGWQQGWLVPAAGGVVDLRFTPDRAYRIALAGGLGLVAVLAIVALPRPWPGRRRRRAARLAEPVVMADAVPRRRYGFPAAAALLLIGGVWAAVVAVPLLIGAAWAGRKGSHVLSGLAAAACVVAGLTAALAAAGIGVDGRAADVGLLVALLVAACVVVRLFDADFDSDGARRAARASRRGDAARTAPPDSLAALATAGEASSEPFAASERVAGGDPFPVAATPPAQAASPDRGAGGRRRAVDGGDTATSPETWRPARRRARDGKARRAR
jgi:arabinofuranan 3-O-arabinosyltransferase